MNIKYITLITLAILLFSCGESNKIDVVGNYDMISRGEKSSILSLTLKDNGTGFLENSEGYQYTKVKEYCTFDWAIYTGEYKIKDGEYEYVNFSMLSNNTYDSFLNARWVIVQSDNGAIELKALTQSESFQDVINYRKK